MSFLQSAFSNLYRQELPVHADEIFQTQKDFLQSLLEKYDSSPLYQKLAIKQEQLSNLDEQSLKDYLSHAAVVDYRKHIDPLVQQGLGITTELPDIHLKTSGTSDAKAGGKLIPTQRSSLTIEREATKRTLAYYVGEHPHSKIFLPYAFSLTAPFDEKQNIGYVSGAFRKANKAVELTMFPSQKVLSIANNNEKRGAIVAELLERHMTPYLRSIHGVPAWPLAIIDMLIERDREKTKKILSKLEYVSIGGGSPGDYKQEFQKRLVVLGLDQHIAGSNNHNASEGFFGAQVRNFDDLSFQGMAPFYQTNFFLFVPEDIYTQRRHGDIPLQDMIKSSKLLHEVSRTTSYFMLFANSRIPWLYDIKDKVFFHEQKKGNPLEYEVIGRYSMSSNIMNEHLESDTIQDVLMKLSESYVISVDHFVAGLQLHANKTSSSFHIIIEGEIDDEKSLAAFTKEFDILLSEKNAQRKLFRENDTRITACSVYIRSEGFIRETMMQEGLAHEQSKIPLLSDHNYEAIVKPLLEYGILKNTLL